MDSARPNRTVRSDEHLLAIARAIREEDIHTITEIAETLDLAKSTVHSHLATLKEHGFIAQKGTEYHIGLRFLDYGIHARNERPIYRAAKQNIDDLAESTQEQVWCITEERYWGVYLYGASGD